MLDRAFVGRTAELAALTTTFTGPDAPWVLLVEGPAGIGKSRLVARFAESAPCRVFSVTGAEDARAQPGYLTDDLVVQLDDCGADAVESAESALAPGRCAEGADVAEAADAVCGGAGFRSEHRAGDQDRTADSAVALVANPRRGPDSDIVTDVLADGALAGRLRRTLGAVETLLVVDDAQWADAESVRLLTFLIRNRPARGFRLLLAFRDGNCPPAITRLLRGPRVRSAHVRVPPFTEADVAGLLPGEQPRRRARLLTASHGNPLYLALLADLPDRELDRALRGENPDPTSNDYAALDRTIRAELSQLPALERAVAQATAVCGAPPDLELLCAAADLPLPTVADALDGLHGRGVVRLTEGAVTFVHPLIRTAAYRLSGQGTLALAHRRTALALRARDAPLPARAAQLEHAMLGPDERSGAELRSAAAQVLADAPASAARWLALAHRIAPSIDPCADAVALGRALLLAGAAERAAAALDPAVEEPGPHQLEALLLSARGARMLGRVDQARGLLALAARLPRRAGDGPVQLELAILEMQDHQDAEGHARLNALFGSAEIDDPAVRAAATALRCLGFVADGQIRAAAELYPHCHQAFENLADTGFREVIHAIPALGWCAYFLDHDRDGLVHLDRAIRVSHRYGRSYALAELQTVRAYALAKLGRLDAALAAADEATDAASTFHYPDLLAFAGAIKLRTLLLTAPADTARTQWHTVAALPRPVMRWWRQVVDTTLTDTARTLGLPAPDPGPPATRSGPLHPTHLARAAHAALAAGDLRTAETLIARSESAARAQYVPDTETSGEPSSGAAAPGVPSDSTVPDAAPAAGLGSQVGAAALARAEYATIVGDIDGAVAAATTAIEAFARAGMVVHRAQAELVAGIAAGRHGDFGRATNRFASARMAFAEAGAQRLLAEVTAAQRGLAGSRSPGDATTLTRREREVAELAAQGRTNKDIATHLYLSPRTVEDHLGRVLRKLSLTSRAGIARKLDELDTTG
ncbi:LuxR C-terminal-related transcriptional regulator [Nocardia asteroides]|uniref:helix-turn-helix transcriptional regulator n=1 Tax=Nocardia asteroides TaxID=1824 RepID=UPI00379E95FF